MHFKIQTHIALKKVTSAFIDELYGSCIKVKAEMPNTIFSVIKST